LLGKVLSVCTFWFHITVTLHSRLVSTDFGTWSYQCSLSNFTPILGSQEWTLLLDVP
jgi:hypothetical protein